LRAAAADSIGATLQETRDQVLAALGLEQPAERPATGELVAPAH
jgi:hypothetical protein